MTVTLAELVKDVMARIAEESGAYFDEDTIKRWLNEGERVIVRQTRILQDIAETFTIKGRHEYPLPRWFWMPRLVMYDDDVLKPIDVERMVLENNSRTPTYYAVWRNSLWIHPAPSESMKLVRAFFYAWPRGMVEDTDRPDIPEAFHGLLVTWAAYRAKQADQAVAEAQALLSEFQQGIMEIVRATAEDHAQGHIVREVWQPEGLF